MTPVTGRWWSTLSSTIVPRSVSQAFDRVARAGAARVLGGLVVHDLRAVLGELGHLLERRALDRARFGNAPRIGGHRAADVGVDVDALGVERVADRDRGEIGAAAPERRDDAVFGRALEAGDDRNDPALEQRVDCARLDAQDRASP